MCRKSLSPTAVKCCDISAHTCFLAVTPLVVSARRDHTLVWEEGCADYKSGCRLYIALDHAVSDK